MIEKYKISIFGTGYVGLTTGICLANLGYQITCCDIDKEKIKKLKVGKIPFFEKGLDNLLEKSKKNIDFTLDYKKAIHAADIIFIAVGTPYNPKVGLDLSAVRNVAQKIAKNINSYKIIVNKSTVPVGTAEMIKGIVKKHYSEDFDVVSNPEFLREGQAVNDFLYPDRIVIGSESKKASRIVLSLYKKIKAPKVLVDAKSAEMIKYVSNAFLATKISFINEIANICEKVGADIDAVREGIKFDPRIGNKFLNPGIGYGGSCFPKDTHALTVTAVNHGHDFHLLKSVIEVNNRQKDKVIKKAKGILGSLKNKQITVLGLAFKSDSDDIRDSVAISLIKQLIKTGSKIKVYDPKAMPNAKKILYDIIYSKNAYQALKQSELLIIATEWKEFRVLNFSQIKKIMKNPNIIDGRNLLDKQKLRKLGFNYYGVGRK